MISNETLEVRVERVSENNLQAVVLKGEQTGEVITVDTEMVMATAGQEYQVNDRLLVEPTMQGGYYVADYYRLDGLVILGVLFLLIALLVTKIKGLKAILGMVYSLIIIVKVTLPLIMAGHSPFLISLLTMLLILPPTFYFTHGFKRQTHAAMLGTVAAMVIAILLSGISISGLHLTGFSSEESSFIVALMGETINIQGLLLAGILISCLGTLNDVTVAQAATVFTLKKNAPDISSKKLLAGAMEIGREHITSMIDTLILVYVGGSLPMLILLANNNQSLTQFMNYEIVAVEVVSMLIGSMGLILAVPITTLIATLLLGHKQK